MHRFMVCCAFFLCTRLCVTGQDSPAVDQPASGGDFSTATEPVVKVPTGVILVKGAWASASDSLTPLPEGGRAEGVVFKDDYFGIGVPFPAGWVKGYDGPPPSDTGQYVLAQINPSAALRKTTRAGILITAQDMFFTPLPASNSLQLVRYRENNLQSDYKLEEPPTMTNIAGRPFTFFAYWSPVAELHWYVLATEIRCHAVEVVLTSRDTKLIGNLLLDLDKMTLPAGASPTGGRGGGNFPVCVKDYARAENMTARVEPVFTEHRVNPVPVRIIIDSKGKVKHIHYLSAFPDQTKAISEALSQWRFKPYLQDGHPVEVETGILFGRSTSTSASSAQGASVE